MNGDKPTILAQIGGILSLPFIALIRLYQLINFSLVGQPMQVHPHLLTIWYRSFAKVWPDKRLVAYH